MKTLTVRRPWAQLIVLGAKDVENRSWPVNYRGPLVIDAGQRWEPEGVELARGLYPDRNDPDWQAALHQGAAATGYLGVVDLVAVCDRSREGEPCTCGPWAEPGEYHWRLARLRPLPYPIPEPGALGLRDPPAEVKALAAAVEFQ